MEIIWLINCLLIGHCLGCIFFIWLIEGGNARAILAEERSILRAHYRSVKIPEFAPYIWGKK